MTTEIAGHLAGRGYDFPSDDETTRLGFVDWFNQKVLGLDSEEYRRAFWREAYATGHSIGPKPYTLDDFVEDHSPCASCRLSVLAWVCIFMGGTFPFWLLATVLGQYVRKCRRSGYYEREKVRRHALADRRRAITVRRTPNGKPTLESIREAYAHVGDSPEAALRLGALLEDLECYVDNHAYVTRGVPGVRGRAGGIKRLLQREAPDLFAHYKAVMRYKALAKKYRQACDCVDPVPVGDLLPSRDTTERVRTVDGVDFPRRDCLLSVDALSAWMKDRGNTPYLKTQEWVRCADRAYAARNLLRDESLSLAAEILRFCDGTLVSLEAAIALKIDPSCVREGFEPDARVKVLVAGKIPVRTSRRVKAWLAQLKKKDEVAA